jgi:hypothetical protein
MISKARRYPRIVAALRSVARLHAPLDFLDDGQDVPDAVDDIVRAHHGERLGGLLVHACALIGRQCLHFLLGQDDRSGRTGQLPQNSGIRSRNACLSSGQGSCLQLSEYIESYLSAARFHTSGCQAIAMVPATVGQVWDSSVPNSGERFQVGRQEPLPTR